MAIEAFDQAIELLPRRLIETNPVAVVEFLLKLGPTLPPAGFRTRREDFTYFFETLSEKNVALPEEVLITVRASGIFLGDVLPRFRTPEPRVVGLVVSVGPVGRDFQEFPRGLAMPVHAAPSPNGRWIFHAGLPFDARLAEHLTALVRASGVGDFTLTERLAFELFGEIIPYEVRGESMDVAALLSILDELHGRRPALFRAACAVVEPASDGRLNSVGYVKKKLDAFVREYGRGTLLVRHPDDAVAAAFDGCFEAVARVASWEDLADFLCHSKEGDLLEPLTRRTPLTPSEVRRLDDLAAGFLTRERRYDRARNLVERALRVGFTSDVSIAERQQFHQRLIGAWNLQGLPYEAARIAAEVLRGTDSLEGDAASWEDLCRATTPLAAVYWNLHRFDDAESLLAPWVSRLEEEPRRVSVGARVRVFNTAARTRSVLGMHPGCWESLFHRSLRLQEATGSNDWGRTLVYLVHAWLRQGQPDEAERYLRRALDRDLSPDTRLYLCGHQAELVRRRGDLWSDDSLDRVEPRAGALGFAHGLYFVATARQIGRPLDDALARLRRAQEFFASVRIDPGFSSLAEFVRDVVGLLEGVIANDARKVDTARERIQAFFAGCPSIAVWYESVWRRVQTTPDHASVEELVARVPYF